MKKSFEQQTYQLGFGLYTWSTGGNHEGTMIDGVMTFWDPTGSMAAYIPDDVDKARVMKLFKHAVEEGAFAQYFESTWFPLVHAPIGVDVIAALAAKVNSIAPERLDDYVMVVKSHWQSIEDNFTWPLPIDFEEAVQQEKSLKTFPPIPHPSEVGVVPTPTCLLDDPGPFLKVPIPEGATHYQDVSCSPDGGLRFFKLAGEPDSIDRFYCVWGMSIVSPAGPRWVVYDRKLLRNTPLISL